MKTFAQFIAEEVNWHRPLLKHEAGELKRVSQDHGIDHGTLKTAFKNGTQMPLPNHVWKKLQNTDSFHTTTPQKAHALAKQYGRDSHSIGKVMKHGGNMPAPVVMKHKGQYHLVGGNTRLMMARAHGVQPQVHMMEV